MSRVCIVFNTPIEKKYFPIALEIIKTIVPDKELRVYHPQNGRMVISFPVCYKRAAEGKMPFYVHIRDEPFLI